MVIDSFHPTNMFLFFQRGVGPISVGIAWTTARWGEVFNGRWKDLPSHVGIGFCDGKRNFCFESHAHTDGWHGPFTRSDLASWLISKEDRRMWMCKITGHHVTPELMRDKYTKSLRAVGMWAYDKPGLFRSWLWHRTRIPIPSSSHKAWCSEAVSRILADDIQLRAAAGVKRHEYLTPASIFRSYKQWTTSPMREVLGDRDDTLRTTG